MDLDPRRPRCGHQPSHTACPHTIRVRFLLALAFFLVAPNAPWNATVALAGTASRQPSPEHTSITVEGVRGLIRAGDYAEAERQGRALLHVDEQIYGTESMPVAEVLDVIAEAMRNGGRSAAPDAEAVCVRALQIKEKVSGPTSPETATSLMNLGALDVSIGEYTKARPLLEQALSIREHALGENHPDVARSLLFLANLEWKLGREQAAAPLIERAAKIQNATLPENDPERTRTMNMLAGLRYEMGDFTTSAELWQRVLSIRRTALGSEHPLVGETLHNLGAVATESGDYDQALSDLEQAYQIRRDRLGTNHELVASTLVVMAAALRALGDRAGAKTRCEEALRIQEHTGNRTDIAWTLRWLADLSVEEGRYAYARRLLLRAKAIQERDLGPQSSDLARTCLALADIAEHEHRSAEADSLYGMAITSLRTAYAESSPDVVGALGRYARFLAATGDSARAFDTALPAALARVEHLRSTTRGLSERQALAFAALGSTSLDVLLALAAANPVPDRVRAAWDILIRTRTVVLDEIAARHRAALAESQDSTAAASRNQLDATRRRFANLLVRGIGSDDPEHYRTAIRLARDEVESAERALAARGGASAVDAREEVGAAQVLASLPPEWGLVAFSRYGPAGSGSYVALVAGGHVPPTAIPLGSESSLDSLVLRYVGLLARGDRKADGTLNHAAEPACRAAGTTLRRRLWDPLRNRIAGIDRILVVPDGALHLLNFASLPDDSGGYLVQSGPLFHILSAERDLVRIPTRLRGTGLLALGGAAFDSAEVARDHTVTAAPPGSAISGDSECCDQARTRSIGRNAQPDCRDFRTTRFLTLPESGREVQEIGAMWDEPGGSTVLTGREAGEAALKALAPGRRVLHLATHGFFLDATRCAMGRAGARGDWNPPVSGRSLAGVPNAGASRGIGGVSSSVAAKTAEPRRGSPLLLSGLALAGANLRLRARPDQDDGVLMAQEIVSLDLSSAEWVVLSACDTGLGKLQTGEGVLGLRRAFEAAGAGAVVMSLWEVEDRSTRDWMRNLYDARFHRRLSTPESVREAARGVLQDRKARDLGTHPFYWAGFVAAGDWR